VLSLGLCLSPTLHTENNTDTHAHTEQHPHRTRTTHAHTIAWRVALHRVRYRVISRISRSQRVSARVLRECIEQRFGASSRGTRLWHEATARGYGTGPWRGKRSRHEAMVRGHEQEQVQEQHPPHITHIEHISQASRFVRVPRVHVSWARCALSCRRRVAALRRRPRRWSHSLPRCPVCCSGHLASSAAA